MRLSTFVLALIFVGQTGGTAAADSAESADMAPQVAEVVEVAAPDASPVAGDSLAPEDAAALDAIAPEATAMEEAPAAMEEAPAAMEEATAMDNGAPAAADPANAVPEETAVADAPAAPAETAPTVEAVDETVSWEDFDDPAFDPASPQQTTPEPQAVAKAAGAASSIPLGPMGVDEDGVEGRIHTVSKGETLWDISEAYLGTPWVWPSVWDENDGIDNPHLIEPGDRIWITSNVMRRISEEEAGTMLTAAPEDESEIVSTEMEFLPEDELVAEEPLPASVEDEAELSVAVPDDATTVMMGESITLPLEQDANFATPEMMEEAPRIADSPSLRALLTQGDEVYLDLGEGEVQVGDEFEIFRKISKIRDLETGAVLGYHYDELGWLEIMNVEGESSTGVIQGAHYEMERGDRIVPRNEPPRRVEVRSAQEPIEGAIVFTPGIRWMVGTTDSVYLNVGSIHGVEVGTQMQVYDAGKILDAVKMPDTVIASLVVISVEPEVSVAFITETDRELEVGDGVRGVMAEDQLAVR